MAEKAVKKDTPPATKEFVVAEKRVDKFTVLRSRIEITPAVCRQCGFDICAYNDLGDYYELNAESQDKAKAALQKHIEVAHAYSMGSIIREDEMPSHWLGDKQEEQLRRKKELIG